MLLLAIGLMAIIGCSSAGKASNTARLNGKWELQKIGEVVINKANGERGAPTLELNLQENRASGFGGCNRYSGRVRIEGAEMSFGPLVSTKMACLGPNVENQYFRLLSGQKRTYRISDDKLYVGEGEEMAVFKRAE